MLQWGHRLSAMETGSERPGPPTGICHSFNGATAFRRWKLGECPRRRTMHHVIASMGPPPFGDGNYTNASDAGPSTWTCFNGATAFRRWKPRATCKPCPLLSRGHIGNGGGRPASMGPPPFGDGNVGTARRCLASMGPPPFGDGNDGRETPFSWQWGHRLSAMASRFVPAFPPELQWGHRLSAMETSAYMQSTGGPWSSRFNGATAFRRWKRLFVARLRHGFMQKRSFPEESVTG